MKIQIQDFLFSFPYTFIKLKIYFNWHGTGAEKLEKIKKEVEYPLLLFSVNKKNILRKKSENLNLSLNLFLCFSRKHIGSIHMFFFFKSSD